MRHPLRLSPTALRAALRAALSETRWRTAGQVCNYLRQAGPLAFEHDQEHWWFHCLVPRKQYGVVYRTLLYYRGGCVDSCLGADDGREVRVFQWQEVTR